MKAGADADDGFSLSEYIRKKGSDVDECCLLVLPSDELKEGKKELL